MNKVIIAVVVTVLLAAGVGALLLASEFGRQTPGTPRSQDVVDEAQSPDAKETYTLEVDGLEREFIVYRPASLAPDAEVPVVFMFHGSGGTGEKMYQISGWKEKADVEGFMAVFPTALKYHVYSDEKVIRGEVKEDVSQYQTKWVDFKLVDSLDPAYDQELHEDIPFVQAMVDFVKETYATDESRFYATGFSNGAGFTVRLAVQMSDVFAAFATSGGGRLTTEDTALTNAYTDAAFTPRPLMMAIGEVDPKITYALGVEAFPMDESSGEEGSGLRLFLIDPILELLNLDDAFMYARQDRAAVYRFETPASEPASPQYTFVVFENMKHVYPNGTNYPAVAANIFWEFFSTYSLL